MFSPFHLRAWSRSRHHRPGVALGIITGGRVGNGKIVSSVHVHGVRNGSGATSSEKLEVKEWEAMELDALINAQLYISSRRQCDD
jgi:hypothetical protein